MSDSSSEEDISKFAEAVDNDLFKINSTPNNIKYESNCDKKNSIPQTSHLPSLRNQIKCEDFSSKKNTLNVTPEFQKFVAKKLEKSLDEFLNENLEENKIEVSVKRKKKKKIKEKELQNVNNKTNNIDVDGDNDVNHTDDEISDYGIKLFKKSKLILNKFNEEDNNIIENNKINNKNKNYEKYDEKKELIKVKSVVVETNDILNQNETKSWSNWRKEMKGEVIHLINTKDKGVYTIKPKEYSAPTL